MQGLDSLVDGFVKALTQLMQREALAALNAGTNLGGLEGRSIAPARSVGGSGGKRARADLDDLRTKVLRLVEDNPGKRVEEINRVLGTVARELALPIKQLLAAEQLRVEGARRGTRYFATGKSASAAPTRRAKRKTKA